MLISLPFLFTPPPQTLLSAILNDYYVKIYVAVIKEVFSLKKKKSIFPC